MKHIYKKNEQYYLVNMDKMKFYKIDESIYSQLEGLNEQEIDEFANNMFKDVEDKVKLKIKPFEEGKCERLILNLTEYCNLACKYCYAEKGCYGQEIKVKNMSLETVKEVLCRVFKLYPKGIGVIQFFGGEPLLNKSVLRDSVIWILEKAKKLNIKAPLFTMVTNGTLIDDDDIRFFNEYFSSITISLDGSKDVNDENRVFKGNNQSVYDKVLENIKRIDLIGRKFYLAIEGTINSSHIDEFKKTNSMNSLNALKELNADIIHISPLISSSDKSFNQCSDEIKFLNKYDKSHIIEFFDKWIEEEFNSGIDKTRLRTLASVLIATQKQEHFGNGCGATNSDIASDVNGVLYPCFMFIGAEEFSLGHATDDVVKQRETLSNVRNKLIKANENQTCNKCWTKPICAKSYSHCIGARYLTNKNIDEPIELICDISKSVLENIFTQAIIRYSSRKKVEKVNV